MAEISLAEFSGQPAKSDEPEELAAPLPEDQPQGQPNTITLDDFRTGKTPGKQMFEDLGIDKPAKPEPSGFIEKGLSAMRSAGGNAGVLADMVLSAPWFAMSVGANIGNQATGLMFGQDLKTAAVSGRQTQEMLMNNFGNPLHKVMQLLGTKEMYEESITAEGLGKVAGWIQQAGDWTEKVSGGRVPSEEVETMVDGIMLLTGARGGDLVKKLWDMRKARPADYVPPEVSAEQTQKQGPRTTAQQDINEMLNIRSTRDRKAYEQKRRREVREAFNVDSPERVLPDGRRQGGGSDYADYLKFWADERVSNHDNWNKTARDTEAREQAARASEDSAVPKPAEPTAGEVEGILNKPGVERTSEDLLKLRRFNEGVKETPWKELGPDEVLPPGMDIKMNMKTGKNYYRPKLQSGFMRPELAARLAAFGIGATAGLWLDPEDPLQASILGGAAAVAPTLLMGGPGKVPSKFGQSGAVKGPGGMWHPEAVERLAKPLSQRLEGLGVRADAQIAGPENVAAVKATEAWADKAIRNYLNKYAGTERDPLKDVEIPAGDGVRRWEDVMDITIEKRPMRAAFAAERGKPDFDPGLEKAIQRAPEDPVYKVRGSSGAIMDYLSHVGDFLRQNVPAEKLGQYDLVRAVRETAANDARVAKEMEKAQSASTDQLPVHKAYPDGFKWVQLELPKELTPEQAKSVRKLTKEERAHSPKGYPYDSMNTTYGSEGYMAIDAKGKPIVNAYTNEPAAGKTPQEAWLAGRLAEEGNAMGHCVGGYCAGVASGESKIFSLRDAKGRSHVTVETGKQILDGFAVDAYNLWGLATEAEKAALTKKYGAYPEGSYGGQPAYDKWAAKFNGTPEFHALAERLTNPPAGGSPDITQIKGKQNRAPNPEYLPYVQDFVKSGKWGEVGDFEHTGLWKNSKGQMFTDAEVLKRAEALHKESTGKFPKLEQMDLDDLRGRGLPDRKLGMGIDRMVREVLELGVNKDWQAGARGRQEGAVDIKTAAKLAGLVGGAAIGASMADNKVVGGILGALGGLVLGGASPRGVANVVKKAWAPDTRIRINQLANSWEYRTEAAGRAVFQLQTRMEQLLPKEADRIAVTHAIESGDLSRLSPRQAEGARIAQGYFARMAEVGQESGVLKDAIANYVTHLWKKSDASTGIVDEIFGRKGGFSMSPETKFSLRRSVPTLAEGKAKGLIPTTEDISGIMGVYGNALNRAMANKELITALKNEKVPGTEQGLVLKDREAPATYQRIDHPQLAGMRVHPDIVPSMKFIFDNHNPGVVMRALDGINMLSKRMAVSFSLFHAKALADAFIGGAKNPLLVGKQIAQAVSPKVFGENAYLKELRNGGAGDLVDTAQKAGLKFSMGKDSLGVEDVRGTFYSAMKDLQEGLDGVVKGAGIPVKGFIKANHAMDRFMWDRLHAGMKLSTFAEKYNTLLENNAKAHERNSQVPLRPKEQLAEMAASFTNDVFGGLNWRRIAEGATTKWGREAALNILSPAGRRVSQIMLFAPDWTLSTARAAFKAFGTEGTGIKGIIEPKTETDLHRQYLVRSAIYYLAVGDAINLAMSGHHLWDNKDPTTIDMGDGRTMQWSKHTMESVHWLTKPRQQGLNKLGFIPREIATQAMGTKYLSAYGKAPPMENRFLHAASGFSPISVQQNFDAGEGAGIAGFLGTPIYGKTYAERQMIKEERRRNHRMDSKSKDIK